MDSRENRSSSPKESQPRPKMVTRQNPFRTTRSSNPNLDPNLAATMMGGGRSTSSTPQSTPRRLSVGSLSLPNPQLRHDMALGLGDGGGRGRGIATPRVTRGRRGRPRNQSGDGNVPTTLSLLPGSNSVDEGANGGEANASSTGPPAKRGRGRPRGPKTRRLDDLGVCGGVGFTPHVIKVKPGEDIGARFRSFAEQGPRTISILSATGTVCKVTLGRSSSDTGVTTYEGLYEIVTLSGSFFNCEVDGTITRIGSLTVTVAGNDGKILGGGVIGELVAATDVQVVVGSFLEDPKKQNQSSSQANMPFSSPGSQGPSFGSSDGNENSSAAQQQGQQQQEQEQQQGQQQQEQEQQQRQEEQEELEQRQWEKEQQRREWKQEQQQPSQWQQEQERRQWKQLLEEQRREEQEREVQRRGRTLHFQHSMRIYDL